MRTEFMVKKSYYRGISIALAHRLSTMMLGLLVFFSSFLCSSAYYQQPEVVQFTSVPSDAVVCEGCRLEMSCSILRQTTTANLPQPQLEWIFNESKNAFHDVRIQTHNTLTHLSLALIIDNATAKHSGTYQCRATDGSDSTHCSDSSLDCVPATTISPPARIQIVGEAMRTEPVSIDSSCSGVAVLHCGSGLMKQGTAPLETLNLTWRRNGEEIVPNSDTEVVLSNGDLAVDTGLNGDGDYFECVASFEQRNVTLARYRIASPQGGSAGSASGSLDGTRDYLRLISSGVVVLEGGSVEFVCEASVIMREEEGDGGGHGLCVPYNVTWSVSSSNDGALWPVAAAADSDTSSLALNNHLLRVSGVSSGSSQYCCQVHTPSAASAGHRISQECTTIHVVPQHDLQAVDPKTIFLKNESDTNISCSHPSAGSHGNITWYHNGDLIEGVYNSSLTLTGGSSMSGDVYGVYQCFSDNGVTVKVASLVRVLPYGLTNPPSNVTFRELPYPSPNHPRFFGTYLVTWRPPVFTGGLTQLQYNVTIDNFFIEAPPTSTNLTSTMVYIENSYTVSIKVGVVSRTATQQISENGPEVIVFSPRSECAGKVLYPPTPSLNCMGGLVNVFWMSNQRNRDLFHSSGIELEYANLSCTHTNGSMDQYHEALNTSPVVYYEDGVAVGTHCRLAMGSVKKRTQPCYEDCFCYDANLALYSHPVECYVQDKAQFVNSAYQAFENNGSVEVCVQAEGYGFTVNVSAVAEGDITPAISHQLTFNSSLHDILCVNISILDDSIVEGAQHFNIVLTTDNELVAVGDPTVVQVMDDDFPTTAVSTAVSTVVSTAVSTAMTTNVMEGSERTDRHAAIIFGAVFGFAFFLIILTVAGSISCLVILIRRKRQLQNSYRIPQDDIGSIDWSVEPAVLISTDNPYFHVKQYSESDFDSKTLLDYLGPSTPDLNTTVALTTVPPLQILSTDQDTMDSDNPQDTCEQKQLELEESRHNKHQTNCYNVSVESGVVLDTESHINVRKISTGSAGNCSHGSSHEIFEHSYIGMADTDMCACTECRQQRERLYSKRAGCKTLEYKSQSNKLTTTNNALSTCTLDDNHPTISSEQCQTGDARLRDIDHKSNSCYHDTDGNSDPHDTIEHTTERNSDCDTTEHTSNADAVHCTSLKQNTQQPTHTDTIDLTKTTS